jgi:hypothetical protein
LVQSVCKDQLELQVLKVHKVHKALEDPKVLSVIRVELELQDHKAHQVIKVYKDLKAVYKDQLVILVIRVHKAYKVLRDRKVLSAIREFLFLPDHRDLRARLVHQDQVLLDPQVLQVHLVLLTFNDY